MRNSNIIELDRISKTNHLTKNEKTNMLLLGSSERSEEVEILKKIGLDINIRQIETIVNNSNRLCILSEKYNRKTYSGEQLKDFCSKKGYQILRADSFKGSVSLEIGKAILEFAKENEVTNELGKGRIVTKTTIDLVESKFYILAPVQTFFTQEFYKSVTLFYNEEPENYTEVRTTDNFIEIKSWNNKIPWYKYLFNELFYSLNTDSGVLNFISMITFIIMFIFGCEYTLILPFILLIFSTLIANFNIENNWNQKYESTGKV